MDVLRFTKFFGNIFQICYGGIPVLGAYVLGSDELVQKVVVLAAVFHKKFVHLAFAARLQQGKMFFQVFHFGGVGVDEKAAAVVERQFVVFV